jgi:ABC-type uncharacterized transport system auxiliary subunit
MNRKYGIIVLIFIVAFGLTCTKKVMVRRYYVIELPAVVMATFADSTQFDKKVDVRDFQIARAFDQTRIALRTNTNELDYYYYHHWAVRPSSAVADFVYDMLVQMKLFSNVARDISYNPEYLITGDVKSIERIHIRKKSYAHVYIIMNFLDADTEEVLVHFQDDQTVLLEPDGGMNTFSRKISEITAEINLAFLQRVEEYLSSLSDY